MLGKGYFLGSIVTFLGIYAFQKFNQLCEKGDYDEL